MLLKELDMQKDNFFKLLHVAPPISNNLPLFGFDAKLEFPFECIWRDLRVETFLRKPESF